MKSLSRAVLAVVGLASAAASSLAATQPYKFVGEIPVGGEGGWDYLSIDATARRLYVSHATKVVVIDIDQAKIVGEIADTPGVHGVAIAADLGRGFSTNGRENKVGVVDLATLKTIAKIDAGRNPDGMVYDPARREMYAFNGRDASATVIDAVKQRVVATIPLGGKPEFPTVDPQAGRIFDNLEDRSEVVAIDSAQHTIVGRWPTAPGEGPSGMAIDAAHHRLFIGCEERLVMMDAQNGRVVASVPIGRGVDANAFDPATQLAFASCGDGTVTIAHEDSPERLTVVQVLKTEPRARTMALDPKTHRIFLATAKFEAPRANAATDSARRRPTIVPGTFKVLIYGSEP